LLYTSGTTGPPKACELTHGNYRAITSALETQDLVRQDDCVYLFLPLAHALALIVQFLVLDVGATLAYWEKDPQKIVANLMELKPTFFPSVPRIFEKIVLRVGCERSPRRPNPAGRCVAPAIASLARTSCPHHWRAGLAERRHGARLARTRLPSGARWRSTIARA
jgi:acyl-CoA synthetase (AMP-forming)/AMP-acid ligase II